MRKSSLQAILWVQEDLARLSGVCSPCWEQNRCCYLETSRDRKTLNSEKERPTHACLSSRRHIWRHNRWGRGRKITLINKETGKRGTRTASCGTPSHENSAADVKKRFCFEDRERTSFQPSNPKCSWLFWQHASISGSSLKEYVSAEPFSERVQGNQLFGADSWARQPS